MLETLSIKCQALLENHVRLFSSNVKRAETGILYILSENMETLRFDLIIDNFMIFYSFQLTA
jgi:hypothetical protein